MTCAIVSVCEGPRSVYPHAKNYEEHAIRLAYSIRRNGGKCKDFPIYLWYGEDCPPKKETVVALEALGCTLIAGVCKHPEMPVWNKIAACRDAPQTTEYLLWLDSDIYVLGDFSSLFDGFPDVAASPSTNHLNNWTHPKQKAVWQQFYALSGVAETPPDIEAHVSGGVGNFYLCSGLILFKTGLGFPELYESMVETVLSSTVPCKEQSFTQTGLSLAVLKGGFSYALVPEHLHYVYCMRGGHLGSDTVLVHYQDNRVVEVSDEHWCPKYMYPLTPPAE